MKRWSSLAVLSVAQFVMVLDQAVMNVSISQLVVDFDTTVTVIQSIITLYSLVMAALMVTGGKIGDLIGRRRAFAVGLVIYSVGSALTAVSWSVSILALGWSVLEGIGAALVLPALVALIAGNYAGRDRVIAYAVIGGVAGVGIAVGPILGGWLTTDYTWRLVFAGEVVLCTGILVSLRVIDEAERPARAPRLDWVGALLSAAGLGLVVLGVLQASTWGWLVPKSSPVAPFGFALTPFVVVGGLGVLLAFVAWQRRRERRGVDPLVRLKLFDIPPLRAGLQTFLAQNLILMGAFFSIPLYLQLVVGLNALETGIRMLPVSIAMFITSMSGSALATRYSPRGIVRAGFVMLVVSLLVLMSVIEPELRNTGFAVAMALLGVGLGLVASQLGNVVQSAVGLEQRSEAGGLQWTAQQLGSSLGVALIGAIVLTGLSATFVDRVTEDERISAAVAQEVSVRVAGGVDFVPTSAVEGAAGQAGLDAPTTEALVDSYAAAQLLALKAGVLAALVLAAGALIFTRDLPSMRPQQDPEPAAARMRASVSEPAGGDPIG
jgi:EmrB/QacA subfamily drug resistance transporter